MNQVTVEQLGYLNEDQIQHKYQLIDLAAENELAIFPCHSVTKFGCGCRKKHNLPKEWGKHPSQGASHLSATSDPNEYRPWWIKQPYDNVGCFAKKSKKLIIDIDPRSSGDVSWVRLCSDLGISEPATWKTITGLYELESGEQRRGFHLWFQYDDAHKFPANLDELGYPGIDIKHEGYVLIPPSRHGSQVNYEWQCGQSPSDIAAAFVPDKLLQLILSGKKKQKRTVYVGLTLPPVNAGKRVEEVLQTHLYEGNRNVAFYKISCSVAYWMGVYTESQCEQVKNVLLAFNETNVHPPLSGADGVLTQIDNAIKFVRNGGAANE